MLLLSTPVASCPRSAALGRRRLPSRWWPTSPALHRPQPPAAGPPSPSGDAAAAAGAAAAAPAADEETDDFEGLLPDEDYEVRAGEEEGRAGTSAGHPHPACLLQPSQPRLPLPPLDTLSPGILPPLLTCPTHCSPPLEHAQVPGTANDSLTSNTQLGRAVGAACEELEGLAALEAEAADAAAELLLKIGYRLERAPPSPPPADASGGRAEEGVEGGGGADSGAAGAA